VLEPLRLTAAIAGTIHTNQQQVGTGHGRQQTQQSDIRREMPTTAWVCVSKPPITRTDPELGRWALVKRRSAHE
jgi:hypothetical protein